MYFDYIIIGSGIAGISAAETLRKHSPSSSICVISNEPHDPYSKVLLPFWLKGKIRQEQLFIRGKNFWEKNNINFIHGQVTALDRGNKKITLTPSNPITAHGTAVPPGVIEEIEYGKLLIASGAEARKLDFRDPNLPGVFYFRNLDDATAIKEYLESLIRHRESAVEDVAISPRKGDCFVSLAMTGIEPAIYGASFIALEFAGIFAYLGIGAKIFFRGPYFWHRLLDPQGGRLVENFLEQAGMEIHIEEEIRDIRPIGQIGQIGPIGRIETNRDSYPCNFLGMGVGLEPNLDFARNAGLKVNQGIITNEYLETNDPHIFAAGDVAEFNDVIIGRHHVLGNWLNSDMQGRTAAMNMRISFETEPRVAPACPAPMDAVAAEVRSRLKTFELVSSYSFTFDGRHLEPEPPPRYVPEAPEVIRAQKHGMGRFDICAIGDTNPEKPFDEKIFTNENRYMRIFIKENCCVGAILINNASLRKRVTEAIKSKSLAKDLVQSLQ